MKYEVIGFSWEKAREGNPFMFTVEGVPQTKAEWDQHQGKPRETCTLAELEARGIALPAALATANADAAKKADALQAERAVKDAEAQQAVAEVSARHAAIVGVVNDFIDKLSKLPA